MFFTVGLDVGSSSIKAALMEFTDSGEQPNLKMAYLEKLRKRNTKDVIQACYDKLLSDSGLRHEDIAYVASTGEGEMVDFRRGHFYSMTCHSRGALFLLPTARSVLDIGALHAKAIVMDERSKVLEYRMTSQCASGSGQFLENISRYLGVATEDVGELSLKADNPEAVSGICAVLAETDVINMVSRQISTANILKGIHLSMARRLVNLLRLMKANGEVLVTGGLAQDVGLLAAIQELADKDTTKNSNVRIIRHERSAHAGAIGAALWAGYRHVRLKNDAPKSATGTTQGITQELRCDLKLGEQLPSVGSLFLQNTRKFGAAPAFAERVNGAYHHWSWNELLDQMIGISAFLSEKRLKKGDRVAFISSNSYNRLITEMAVMASGMISVPIFADYPNDLMAELLNFSEVKFLVADSTEKLAKLPPASLPPQILLIRSQPEITPKNEVLHNSQLFYIADVLRTTRSQALSTDVQARWESVRPDDQCLIMYTSGTSSFPKGVQLTHGNLMSQQKALELLWKLKPGMRFLCYLPWHHSFGGLFERFCALYSGGCLAIDDSGGRNIDQLFRNLADIKPNIFFSVPKIYQEIVSRVLNSREAEATFFSSELKFIFTAAAPLPISTSNIFKAKKIPVIEGWGLTETSPCCTLTPLSYDRQPGVVGFPIPGVEVKLAEEGEILVRGPNLMTGYFKNPEATKQVLSQDGWFSTGDIGEITADGLNLKIISRKDRMFKLSNGEKVFPAVLEENIKTRCKFIKYAYVFGRGRSHPAILIFPNRELYGAKKHDLDHAECQNPNCQKDLSSCLSECIGKLNAATGARFETITEAVVVEREPTIERHELTPSFKLIPRKIEESYRDYLRPLEENRPNDLPKDAHIVAIKRNFKR